MGLGVMVLALGLFAQVGCNSSNEATIGATASVDNPATQPADAGKDVAKTEPPKRPAITPDFQLDPDPGTIEDSGYGPPFP